MKIFINTTILQATGIVQVAVSFINECKAIPENQYVVLINQRIEDQLDIPSFPTNFTFFRVSIKPLHFLRNFFAIRELKALEKKHEPDCVFTVFGPSWWTPKAPHLMGYAHPQYVYEDSPYYTMVSKLEMITKNLKKRVHGYALKKNGGFYVCETEDVCDRLSQYLKVDKDHLFSASNTYNHFFEDFEPQSLMLAPKASNEFRFISLCAFYKHKNLQILNEVIPVLAKRLPHVKLRFVLTIGQEALHKHFSPEVMPYIICLERVDVKDCPQLYYESDALFLPTLLECFTANYPEAMKMEKPIVTSDMSFATTICEDAALFCDATDAVSVADEMEKLIDSKDLRATLVKAGSRRLKQFLSSKQRAEAYLAYCTEISNLHRS